MSAHRPKPSPIISGLALGTLLAAVAVMAARTASAPWLVGLTVTSLAVGVLFAGPWATAATSAPEDRELMLNGFRWLARIEGATLLFMLGISIPLRLRAGIDLDGETEVIGWIHGVFFILYLQSIWSTSREMGWSWLTFGLGILAGFIPAGTFLFEYRMPGFHTKTGA